MSSIYGKKETGQICAKLLPKIDPPKHATALLATGILEGDQVRCLDGSGKVETTGTIKNKKVLCNCKACKGEMIVSLTEFERHAQSFAKHPSDNIYLENGKNLRQVMEASWEAAKNKKNVLESLYKATGPYPNAPDADLDSLPNIEGFSEFEEFSHFFDVDPTQS